MTEYHSLSFERVQHPAIGTAYRVVLDGISTTNLFHIDALVTSSFRDGVYPLVLCSCSDVGCGGMFVSVRTTEDSVIWEKFWNGQSDFPWTAQFGEEPGPEDLRSWFGFRIEPQGEGDSDFLWITPPLYFRLSDYRRLADDIESQRDHPIL